VNKTDIENIPISEIRVACGYVERLLSNSRVEKHLDKHHSDILGELRTLLADVKPQKGKSPEVAA
jgi:hypothetical protein